LDLQMCLEGPKMKMLDGMKRRTQGVRSGFGILPSGDIAAASRDGVVVSCYGMQMRE
jgi:hypothetical protein